MTKIKSFEDFLDKMQGLLDNAKKQGHIIVRVEDLENAFPELRESEDERIRNEIIAFVEQAIHRGGGTPIPQEKEDRWIAWLEKQEKSELSEDLGEYVVELSKQFPEVSFGKLARIAVRVKNWLEKQNPNANNEYWRGYREGKQVILDKYAELEKQEKKPVEEYNITGISSGHATGKLKEIIKDIESEKVESKFKVGDEIKTGNEESLTITKIDEKGYWSEDLFICSFEDSAKWELVGRLVDKIEPKFHEGDWVVYDGWITRILKVTHDGYVNDKQGFIPKEREDCMRLWDITKDAKDGDVLACESGWTCIFKFLNAGDTFSSYCFMDRTKSFFETGSECHTLNEEFTKAYNGEIKPATKEQRDTLFAKMKEAGYAFNFEEKELKKLGQPEVTKTSDQEEIAEIPFGAKDSELQEAIYNIPKGFHAEIDNDKVVIKKGEKPTAWSDEDERNMQNIDSVLFYDKTLPEETCVKLRNFLKTLKDRVGCEANCTTTKEWSEGDEFQMQGIIELLPGLTIRHNWLKSLKDRIQLHKQWKPSEEQVKAFEHFVRSIGESGYASPYENNTKILYSLLEQLKKL